jgi:rod shape-determining protein MreC
MNFLKQNKKIIIPILIVIVLFLCNVVGFTAPIDLIKKPILFAGTRFYSLGSYTKNVWSVLTQGTYLAKKAQELENQIKRNEFEKIKNYDLTDFPNFEGFSIIEARIVMSASFEAKRTILIDKGSDDGVFKGSAAITKEGVFVGKVIEAKKTSSSILLSTDTSSVVAVSKSDNSQIQAIARGMQGLSILMDLVPQDSEIKKDDIIITSILEENIPQGLLVGKVNSVKYNQAELFKQADLIPLFSLSSLKTIGIVVPKF